MACHLNWWQRMKMASRLCENPGCVRTERPRQRSGDDRSHAGGLEGSRAQSALSARPAVGRLCRRLHERLTRETRRLPGGARAALARAQPTRSPAKATQLTEPGEVLGALPLGRTSSLAARQGTHFRHVERSTCPPCASRAESDSQKAQAARLPPAQCGGVANCCTATV